MTAHQTQNFIDGSRAIRPIPGGPWEVKNGPTNGRGDIFDCDASRFVEVQNSFISDFHEAAVRERRGRERAA